jgi:hypothetical protein
MVAGWCQRVESVVSLLVCAAKEINWYVPLGGGDVFAVKVKFRCVDAGLSIEDSKGQGDDVESTCRRGKQLSSTLVRCLKSKRLDKENKWMRSRSVQSWASDNIKSN